MPQRCTVCSHPERREIDKTLALGQESKRAIARQHGLTHHAVLRHADEHLPARLVKAQEAADVRHAIDVVQQLKAANTAAWQVLRDAREAGKGGLVLASLDRIQRQVELQAKLIGQLDERPVVNVLITTEWVALRSALLDALAPYDDARVAVAGALGRLGAG